MTDQELIRHAIEVSKNAYAPYSNFSVGAALLTEDGTLFTGCNVENASYGLAICAERNAVCQAVAKGHRAFQKIAIVATHLAPPCGACRQFLFEFGNQLEVICASVDEPEAFQSFKIDQLLPHGFEKSNLTSD